MPTPSDDVGLLAKLRGSRTSFYFKTMGIAANAEAALSGVFKTAVAVGKSIANYRNMEALANVLNLIVDDRRNLLSRTAIAVELNARSGFFSIAWTEDAEMITDRHNRAWVIPAVQQMPLLTEFRSSIWRPRYEILRSPTAKYPIFIDELDLATFRAPPGTPEIFVINTQWNVSISEWLDHMLRVQRFLHKPSIKRGLVAFWEPSRTQRRRFVDSPNPEADLQAAKSVQAVFDAQKKRHSAHPDDDGPGIAHALFIRHLFTSPAPNGDSKQSPLIGMARIPCGPRIDFIVVYKATSLAQLSVFETVTNASVLRRPQEQLYESTTTEQKGGRGVGPLTRMTGAVHFSGELQPIEQNRFEHGVGHRGVIGILTRKLEGMPFVADELTCLARDLQVVGWRSAMTGYSWRFAERCHRFISRLMRITDINPPASVKGPLRVILIAPKLPTLEWSIPSEFVARTIVTTNLINAGSNVYPHDNPSYNENPTVRRYRWIDKKETQIRDEAALQTLLDSHNTAFVFNLDWGERTVISESSADDRMLSAVQPEIVQYSTLNKDLRLLGRCIAASWASTASDVEEVTGFQLVRVVVLNVPGLRTDIELSSSARTPFIDYRGVPVSTSLMSVLEILDREMSTRIEEGRAHIYPFQYDQAAAVVIVRGSRPENADVYRQMVTRAFFESEVDVGQKPEERKQPTVDIYYNKAIQAAKQFMNSPTTSSKYANMTMDRARLILYGLEQLKFEASGIGRLRPNAEAIPLMYYNLLIESLKRWIINPAKRPRLFVDWGQFDDEDGPANR